MGVSASVALSLKQLVHAPRGLETMRRREWSEAPIHLTATCRRNRRRVSGRDQSRSQRVPMRVEPHPSLTSTGKPLQRSNGKSAQAIDTSSAPAHAGRPEDAAHPGDLAAKQ